MAKPKKMNKSKSGRLRIVAGNWRSRFLDIADVDGLRPTSERIRETLFNWLAPSIEGAHCLDLFAGTGALGLEALSRGAASTVFVEQSSVAEKQLKQNVRVLSARGASIHRMNALEYLANEPEQGFDIVFLDPPFAADMLDETCRLIVEQQLLNDGALVYLEQDRTHADPALPDRWEILKDKTAGNVRYLLIKAG